MEVEALTENRKTGETSRSLGIKINLVLNILKLKCLEAV